MQHHANMYKYAYILIVMIIITIAIIIRIIVMIIYTYIHTFATLSTLICLLPRLFETCAFWQSWARFSHSGPFPLRFWEKSPFGLLNFMKITVKNPDSGIYSFCAETRCLMLFIALVCPSGYIKKGEQKKMS